MVTLIFTLIDALRSPQPHPHACGFALFSFLIVSSDLRADLPTPRLDVLQPAGVAAGSAVEVTITGPDLEGCETLLCGHPGLKAELVKERTFKLTAAGDVPPGTYDVYASGRFGVSNPRLLHVTRGMTDVAEVEPNNNASSAQAVAMNVALNGQADGNNQDFFRFPLKAGQRVTLDCLSARLETEMDPLLALFAADGRQVATNADYHGRDPLIDFVAPADGDYVVEVRDLTYRGGYPYRLLIHDRPRVEQVFPRVAKAGQTVELTAFGANLGDGAQRSEFAITETPLDRRPVAFTASNDLLPLGLFRYRQHPLAHSVLPTAATCTIVGEQFLPFEADPCVMVVTDLDPQLEQEPNDAKDSPQKVVLPTILSARFDKPRDVDWYSFDTDDAGGTYGFDIYAERIDGHCDPYLALYDENGNRFFELDDFGHRMSAFDGHLRDPAGQTNLPGKKTIRMMVQDRYQRGGVRTQYVLSIRKATTDVFAAAIHNQNTAAGLTVWQGGATHLDVVLHHVDGGDKFPVTITAENLPQGVHALPMVITNNTRGSLVLWSDDSAPVVTAPIKLLAMSEHGDRELRREVRPYTRAYQQVGSRPMREQMLAVRERAPYSLRLEPERITVEAGKPAALKLHLTRFWPEFTNAVNFQPLNFPGQFQLGNGTINAGQTEATVSITVQPNTPPGDYTLTVLGQAQVPFHKDPNEQTRPMTLVPMPSRPVTITVTAAAK
ncbi:MAG TPA: PPC domain-containing protein [Planctomycetaceae bacterium]|nr:PPC domain-containing protein [Planctomycetaceae bacterium]